MNPISLHLQSPSFCTSRLLRQDMSGSTHISPAAFVSRNTAASVLMPLRFPGTSANCKTEYHHVITCRIMQVCIPEKFIFQTIPVRCQTIQKTCHFTAFSVNRHKNNSRILRARCFIISSVHASLGGKHTLSTDAACTASSENIVRNSNLSSSFIFHLL